jgi:basic membrane protein A
VVFDVGGLGDRGFNDLAYQGMMQANKTLGVDYKYQVATSTTEIPSLFATLISDHLSLIVGVGFDDDQAISQYAAQYPNQKFAQVDGDIYNVTNLIAIKYQEHVGSAIVGALAAALAGNGGKIGFLGGVTTGIIYKFWNGWKFGASWADSYLAKMEGTSYNTTLDQVYDSTGFNGFADPSGGFSNGQAMIARGDTIIFTAAGGTGIGTFNAIGQYDQQHGWSWTNTTAPPVWAIGVDANQDYYGTQQYFSAAQQNKTASNLTPPSFVLTSEIKKVDLGVFDVMKWVTEGNYSGLWNNPTQFAPSFFNGQTQLCGSSGSSPCYVRGVFLLGLKQGAVGPTSFQYTIQFLTPTAKRVMAQITAGILNGTITVPENYGPSSS